MVVPALPDLIWGTVAFVIIALAVYKFAWPSFSATLDERREKIEDGLSAAAHAQMEMDREREKLLQEKNEAQADVAVIREKAQAQAKGILSDAQVKAREQAQSIVEGAHVRIAADTDAAKRQLRSELGTVATELAGKIVGEALTDERMARRVIDRFLDELDASAPARRDHAQARSAE